MADAFWMQLGQPVFALEVGGQIVGITYWLDSEALGSEGDMEAPAVADNGWYFVATARPRDPERIAHGLELRQNMAPEELAETAQWALEEVANEVLADGGEE